MISWSKNSNRFPKDIFLTRDRSKIPFCRERCEEGIMRGAWVEIIIIGTHTLRAPVPINSSIDTHQIQSLRRSVRQKCCAHAEKTKRRVLCPRVPQAAMIAAASFGLRRSGTFCDGNIGSGLLGRISEAWPPWPLPVNAPKSIFQKSNLYRAANSADTSSMPKSFAAATCPWLSLSQRETEGQGILLTSKLHSSLRRIQSGSARKQPAQVLLSI